MNHWKIGTRLLSRRTGRLYEIRRITEAGAAGTRFSDGPTWHAAIVDDYGTVVTGSYVVDIHRDSLSSPSRDFIDAVTAMNPGGVA